MEPRQTNGAASTTAVTYDVRVAARPLEGNFFITDCQAMEGASLYSSTNEPSQQYQRLDDDEFNQVGLT